MSYFISTSIIWVHDAHTVLEIEYYITKWPHNVFETLHMMTNAIYNTCGLDQVQETITLRSPLCIPLFWKSYIVVIQKSCKDWENILLFRYKNTVLI